MDCHTPATLGYVGNFGLVVNFRIARYISRIDAKSGDHDAVEFASGIDEVSELRAVATTQCPALRGSSANAQPRSREAPLVSHTFDTRTFSHQSRLLPAAY
jgi:acetate kinase